MSKPQFQSSHNSAGQIRTVIVEDDVDLRETMAAAVEKSPALALQGHYGCAEDCLAVVGRLLPDVAVIDMRLPGMDGISCIVSVKQAVPTCQVLVQTAFEDAELILRAFKAGASGYLIKCSNPNELVMAIQDVWEGGAPMSASVARKVVQSFHEAKSNPCEILTTREEEVLRLLSQGHHTKEISGIVGVSYATVRFHLRNIYTKLHVNNRTQAVLKYLG